MNMDEIKADLRSLGKLDKEMVSMGIGYFPFFDSGLGISLLYFIG
jgi:hypothetical protein